MRQPPVQFSLIIPCYNEARNLPLLVERCGEFLARAPTAEVVLVDNGSTDDTAQVMARLLKGRSAIRLVRIEVNRGYGLGIVSGLRAAKGEVLGWTHADLQTDPADALRALDLFEQAADPRRLYVKGRRLGRPWFDVLFTHAMSAFETALTGVVLQDINAQPNIFHRSFFETWRAPPNDFSLDLYAYWQAKRAKLAVKRIPCQFPERIHGTSHWNTGLAGKWRFIRRTMDFSLRLRFKGVD